MATPSAIQASGRLRKLAGAGAVASTSALWPIASTELRTAANDLQQLQRSQANKRRRVERAGRSPESAASLVGVRKATRALGTQAAGSSAAATQHIAGFSNKVEDQLELALRPVRSRGAEVGLARGGSSNSAQTTMISARPAQMTTRLYSNTISSAKLRRTNTANSLPPHQPSFSSIASAAPLRHFSLFRSTPPAKDVAPQPQTTLTSSSPPPPPTANRSGLSSDRVPVPPSPPPRLDELNTLLRHPALYEPLMRPKNPLVLCHGTSRAIQSPQSVC